MSVSCCEIDVRPQVLLGRKLCLKLFGCLTLLSSIFLGWVKSLTELSRVMEEVYYLNLQMTLSCRHQEQEAFKEVSTDLNIPMEKT